jgi:hypothetical protein
MDSTVDNVSDLRNAESEHVVVLTAGIENTATNITIKNRWPNEGINKGIKTF